MNIYQSDFLSIEKQDQIFIQKWTDSKLTIEDYKNEMLTFLDIFNQNRPKTLIWDNSNCNLEIPEELDNWMGSEILIPIYKKGIKSLILTIPESTSVHLSIVNSLEKAKPILKSVYFNDVNQAKFHATSNEILEEKTPVFNLENHIKSDVVNLNLTISINDLASTIASIKQISIDNEFINKNIKKFQSLTFQEITVLKLIALGNTNKQISDKLFIEESSVKTHRKHIKSKLDIHSNFDIYRYAQCFGFYS